jgi:hypothetical protein
VAGYAKAAGAALVIWAGLQLMTGPASASQHADAGGETSIHAARHAERHGAPDHGIADEP